MSLRILQICVLIATLDLIVGFMSYMERRLEDRYWEGNIVELAQLPIALDVPLKTLVTVTIYHPVREQTDEDPDVLASGKRIQIERAGEYRYCAVSRDHLRRWGGDFVYGDIIAIQRAGIFDGLWCIQDTMHARWTNRIDLLLSPGAPLHMYEGAVMHKV